MASSDGENTAPMHFASQAEWAQWLARHHDKYSALWLRHAKKAAPLPLVAYAEALEVALCFGWIDGIKKSIDAHYWMQRWTPRKPGSIWSKVNRENALRYIEEGKMQPAGLAAIERAGADGRWEAAYDPASNSTIPADVQAAFDAHPGAWRNDLPRLAQTGPEKWFGCTSVRALRSDDHPTSPVPPA